MHLASSSLVTTETDCGRFFDSIVLVVVAERFAAMVGAGPRALLRGRRCGYGNGFFFRLNRRLVDIVHTLPAVQ